jgi:glycerol-3-phosphate cytidylyltransferase
MIGSQIPDGVGGASMVQAAASHDANDVRRFVVVTFGTFDLIHVGHIRLLERASQLGTMLIVGVSTDALSAKKKGRLPVQPEDERLELVRALRFVDQVFLEYALEEKEDYLRKYHADVLVMGDDWQGKFDYLSHICEVRYLPRTPSVSTTATIERILEPGIDWAPVQD